MMKKITLIRQVTDTECGLCCCAMILRAYGSKESIKELQDCMDIGRDGLSIGSMKQLFADRGIDAKSFKVENIEQLQHIKQPFIAFVEQKHYVIVNKITDGKVFLVDPADGIRKIGKDEFQALFSNVILVTELTEGFKPVTKRAYNPWRNVFHYIFEKKSLVVQVLICMLISYGLNLLIPTVVEKIVNKATSETNAGFLPLFMGILVGLMGGCFMVTNLRILRFVVLNVFLSRKLEADTFKHLLMLPYKFFETRSNGDLLYRLQCTTGVRDLISGQLLEGIVNVGSVVTIIGFMIYKSFMLTAFTILIFAIIITIVLCLQPKMTQAINGEIYEQTKSQAAQIEAIYTILPVKISGIEKNVYSKWEKKYENLLSAYKNRILVSNFFNVTMGLLQMFAPVFVLCLGVWLYYQQSISLGEVIAFQSLSGTFFGLGVTLVNAYPRILIASQTLERISDIWFAQEDEVNQDGVQRELTGDVELENVSFSYTKKSKTVLKNLTLHIKAGEKIAIVGESGSGKSTLSKLLVGLYKPTDGKVLYDGLELGEYAKDCICGQVGIVPQDAVLFNNTILENIILGNNECCLEDVKEVAKIACIHSEIEAMPMGYHTLVSEMGMNLSGGQRQRILLARALLHKPRILVLDEATSSLDNVNEREISAYLSRMGCTRIIIAHRLSTIVDADCIYVIKDGLLVEQGKHNALMERRGEYYKLYRYGEVESSNESE